MSKRKTGPTLTADPVSSQHPPHLRRRNAETFLKQFAEVIGIIVAYQRGNLLNATVVPLFQQFLGFFQANVDQVSDRCVPGL